MHNALDRAIGQNTRFRLRINPHQVGFELGHQARSGGLPALATPSGKSGEIRAIGFLTIQRQRSRR